jgi:DNA repair exonuclease SbcCD ATPase subunit
VSDSINHPPHYTHGGIETIDFIEAKELNWNLGNVVKYVSRAGHKGDKLEDLKKAAWYLRREIERLGDQSGDVEADMMRQRDDARKEAEKWKMANTESQAEIRKRAIECDEIRQAAKLERRELLASLEQREAEFAKAINQRDEDRKQIAELTEQLEESNKTADKWSGTASRMQDARDAAVRESNEFKRLYEARAREVAEAHRLADLRFRELQKAFK